MFSLQFGFRNSVGLVVLISATLLLFIFKWKIGFWLIMTYVLKNLLASMNVKIEGVVTEKNLMTISKERVLTMAQQICRIDVSLAHPVRGVTHGTAIDNLR